MHSVFHVPMLKKCTGYPVSLLLIEGLEFDANLSYEEVSVEILDQKVKKMRNKEVALLKVVWKNYLIENVIWEIEADMMSRYPHIFPFSSSHS